MKNKALIIVLFAGLIALISSFTMFNLGNSASIETTISNDRTVSKEAKEYWYDGNAEISSYKLSQARYGEIHEGTAVLIYVTEPFSKKSNTKADSHNNDNVPVLKLNSTKKFDTGIYPYSLMTSSFFPFENGNASLKISSSQQEWCGMTHMEMKNGKKGFSFDFNSYFEGASFNNKNLEGHMLEDDLWSLIRLNPDQLPTGEHMIIPSLSYMNLTHTPVAATKAKLTLSEPTQSTKEYKIDFPDLNRGVKIEFEAEFPHSILSWEETYKSGYGSSAKMLTTKAERIETVKIDYWNKNRNQHKEWRGKLGL